MSFQRAAGMALQALANVPGLGSGDPLGISKMFAATYRKAGIFCRGRIITYNPQCHTAMVSVSVSSRPWPCSFVDERVSLSFGYSESRPPREGDTVIVVQVAPGVNGGIVVGRSTEEFYFNDGDKYKDPEHGYRRLYTQLKETGCLELSCMGKPLENVYDSSSHVMTQFRPTDVYPGEMADVNQHNCGIKGGMFSATLLGGGASVRASALTNCVRVSGESYQRCNLQGSIHEFHNGRYLSSERNGCLYQEERLGWWKPDAGNFESNVWTKDSEAPTGGENQTMRPRVKELSGLFGHLVSRFCLRPDPDDKAVRVQGDSQPKEAGVSRETIDPSGQYRLSAAGMVVIERTGRIPVPVRVAHPTDKGHDIDKKKPEVLKPFEHKEGDPCYRQLELYDRQAYDLKTQYARVDGLGMDKPDYYVPQEEDLKGKVKNEYDENFDKNETVKLEEYDGRRAGMYIGEDGSVIIRDAWGSEIVMLGGNVSISCAGNVMILPGQTALTVAGDDIVQKAQNSVDIHASEHDVRLSAARNMEILGGADEDSHQGGVIIESRGSAKAPWDGEDKGETAQINGITLKSKKQNIVVDAHDIVMRSRKKTSIVSGEEDIDGEVDIAAGLVKERSKQTFMSSDNGTVYLSSSGVSVVGDQLMLNAKMSLVPTQGTKYPIPLKWEDIGTNMAEEFGASLLEATKSLSEESSASGEYSRENLDKMKFGFRTPQECRTDRSWVIGDTSDIFKMYEPAWIQVKNKFKTLKDASVGTKEYKEEADWDSGMPFPGEDSGAKYAKLASGPENLTDDGFNVSRKNVKPTSSITEVSLEGNYQVRRS